ncbi:TetR/AcrR family transcriptional regulator [Pseudomonas segetis]
MTGLRARQKAQRRQEIADSALAVFSELGFSAATLDQIATRAGVSSPTVVNYFGGKQEILLELLRAPDTAAIERIRYRAERASSLVNALCEIDTEVAMLQLEAFPPKLWAEIAPALIAGDLQDIFKRWNDGVVFELKQILHSYQRIGMLKLSVSVDATACIVSDLSNMAFVRLVTQPQPDLHNHAIQMRKTFDVLCAGIETTGESDLLRPPAEVSQK